MPEAPYFFV